MNDYLVRLHVRLQIQCDQLHQAILLHEITAYIMDINREMQPLTSPELSAEWHSLQQSLMIRMQDTLHQHHRRVVDLQHYLQQIDLTAPEALRQLQHARIHSDTIAQDIWRTEKYCFALCTPFEERLLSRLG